MDEGTQLLIDALMLQEEEVGASINWNGADYPCAGGSETISKVLELGGVNIIADTPIIVRTSVFGSAGVPKEKNRLNFTSAPGVTARRYRIDGITYFRGALMVLHCNSDSKGA